MEQSQGGIGSTGAAGPMGQSRGVQGGMGSSQTGTPDPIYDLVSVLYHALESGSTLQQYIQDAQQSGDNDLVQFFQGCQQQQRQCADRAKHLLGQKFSASGPAH
jgi:hypothetical protein